MKKMKLSSKAVLSLVLSAVLFCMPALGFAMNGNYAVSVHAEETEQETESGSEENSTENETEQETESGSEENSTEEDTVSGGDVKEPECTCEDKCGAYEYDHNCEVCVKDYKLCAYKKPNVTIQINQPDGWHNDKATVTFTVADVAHTGNFEIAKIQAKVGQNGSWTDVTEDRKLEISENCTVYVQVTDQKGNTYERSRAIKCFDTTKPTLNAAVSDGLLSVQVHDTDSGAKAVYVNGYEFTDLTNGTLNIRLQQFDAGYEYFTISAMDNAGNMSEVYKTKNPYYKDPADESDENPAEQLPVNAEATKPGSATGTVTEHTKTDSNGNTTSQTSPAEQKKLAMAEADASEKAENEDKDSKQSGQGKEFYTIQTASDKVFYLIIDRDGEEEMVYFLTEITENDLLNTTSDNSETLPKNSAALESAIPTSESALPNNNAEQENKQEEAAEDTEGTEEDTESTEEPEETEVKEQANPMISYILMGGLAVAVIGGAYYFKVVRKKKEDFIEDEDEDEEDNEEYENEDEESEGSSDDDFFEEQEEE
ncbi:MAG: CD1107 family mobile element protein [Lachnospiraceae bacterium]